MVAFISSMDEATVEMCELAVESEFDDCVIPADNSSTAVLTDDVSLLRPVLLNAICEHILCRFPYDR
jgi:hypothetical protein